MAEGLATLEGEQIDLDGTEAAFAAAMAAPPADKPGMAAPPRKPPEPAADPEAAPHGWTWSPKDGEWRPKQAPGRPRGGGDKPRVTANAAPAAKAAPSKPAAPKASKDYRKVVGETLEGVWFLLATAPIPDVAFGQKLTGLRTKLRVQAALIEQHSEPLTSGVATIAAHNRFVARALDRLESGDAGLWVLPACMMLAPFVAATAQLWTGKLETDLDELAAQTEAGAVAYVQAQVSAAQP